MAWFLKGLYNYNKNSKVGYKGISTKLVEALKIATYKEPVGVFISIPKNGTVSTRDALRLGRTTDNYDHKNYTFYKNPLIIDVNHARAAELNLICDFSNLFVFCFSRNPYARCISWYYFHKDSPTYSSLYSSLTFKEWVNKGMPHHWYEQGGPFHSLEKGISPLLQYNFVEHYKIDFVGKLENFQHDMAFVIDRLNQSCKRIFFSYKFEFSHIEVSHASVKPNADYRTYYDKNTKATVYSLLKKDFEHFGYDK